MEPHAIRWQGTSFVSIIGAHMSEGCRCLPASLGNTVLAWREQDTAWTIGEGSVEGKGM